MTLNSWAEQTSIFWGILKILPIWWRILDSKHESIRGARRHSVVQLADRSNVQTTSVSGEERMAEADKGRAVYAVCLYTMAFTL